MAGRDIDTLHTDATERLVRLEATLGMLVKGLQIEIGKLHQHLLTRPTGSL